MFTLLGPVDEVDDDDARLIDFYTYPDDPPVVLGPRQHDREPGRRRHQKRGRPAGWPALATAPFSPTRHAADDDWDGRATFHIHHDAHSASPRRSVRKPTTAKCGP